MKYFFTITLILFFINCQAQKVNKKLEKLYTEIENNFQQKKYEKAIEAAETIFAIEPNNLLALQYKLSSCITLKKDGESIKTANQIIAAINESNLFAYLPADGQKRALLRQAYNIKAWIEYTQSKKNADLERALQLVNKAISITSPIDKDSNLPAYLDTKVRILLKMRRENEAYATTQKALKIDANALDLQHIKQSEGYKKYVVENNKSGWPIYQKGNEIETAFEALNRYEKFVKSYENEEGVNLEFNHLKWKNKKFKISDLEQVEQKFNFKFPADYVLFVTKYGNFSIAEGYDLLNPDEITRLSTALRKEWSINLEKKCKAIQIENLDNLICFGTGEEDRQDIWYYVFSNKTRNSTTGFMEVLAYNQDDWWELTETPQKKYESKRGGFDANISAMVDMLINSILEEN